MTTANKAHRVEGGFYVDKIILGSSMLVGIPDRLSSGFNPADQHKRAENFFYLEGMMNIDPSKVNLSEKDIEDWLWENPHELEIDHWLARQLDVPSGRIDLLGSKSYDGKEYFPVIVEVKNVQVDSSALTQVCRYTYDIKQSLIYRDKRLSEEDIYVEKLVIGKGNLDNRVMFEANALDVEVRVFQTLFALDISGSYSWNAETEHEHRKKYEALGESDIFDGLIAEPEYLEETNSDEGTGNG